MFDLILCKIVEKLRTGFFSNHSQLLSSKQSLIAHLNVIRKFLQKTVLRVVLSVLVFNPGIVPFHGVYFEFLLTIRSFDFKLQTTVNIYAGKHKGGFLEPHIFRELVIPVRSS